MPNSLGGSRNSSILSLDSLSLHPRSTSLTSLNWSHGYHPYCDVDCETVIDDSEDRFDDIEEDGV